MQDAIALWTVSPGQAELRSARLGALAPGHVRVRAIVSGVSRGTESLVVHGRVPESEWARMRGPHQEGAFPFPVKYGYSMVGRVETGPAERLGERVFCLHPHQSLFDIPADQALPLPGRVSDARAALAPQMETALNATWDRPPRPSERVAVVGAGVIGLLTAYLCARKPGVQVALIDINPERAKTARALGLDFHAPEAAPKDCDLVFHASGTAAGLDLAMSIARFEAEIVELSWFGEGAIPVHLGGAFHSQRLCLRASQVGAVAPGRRRSWSHARRLAHALALCADPRLDALVREETPFAEAPARFGAILAAPATLCHLIRYPEA